MTKSFNLYTGGGLGQLLGELFTRPSMFKVLNVSKVHSFEKKVNVTKLTIDFVDTSNGGILNAITTGISQKGRTLGRRYKVSSNVIKNIRLNFCWTCNIVHSTHNL